MICCRRRLESDNTSKASIIEVQNAYEWKLRMNGE